MSRFSAFHFFLAITSLCASGCGETPPGGLPAGTELTLDQRVAVLDAATEKLNSLNGKTLDEISQELLNWAKGRPEIQDSGLTDSGDLWAIYSDGQLFVVSNNRDINAPSQDPSGSTPKLKYEQRAEKTLELPSTLNARLASMFGNQIAARPGLMGAWLQEAGYNVAVAHELTIEAFKGINGSHSIVTFDTHGVRLPPGSPGNPGATHKFLLASNTYMTAAVQAAYQAEINAGVVIPGVATYAFTNGDGSLTVRPKPVLWITAEFVRRYMKFAKDSFVFVNACDSYSTDFRDACFEVGASVYGGWSKPVYNEDAVYMAALLFDRMLGGNRVHPIPTPRRSAQNWLAIYNEMKSNGTDIKSGTKGQTQLLLAENPNGNGGDFAQFSPSISDRMRVDEEKGYLIISGFFGYRPGKVTINGTELELVGEWGPTRLGCRIPNSGANAAGTVQVWVDGRPSNSANLTMWEGTLNLTSHSLGSLTTTAEITVRLRGDVRYDLTPDAQLPSSSIVAQWKANSDSTCKVNAFGEYTDGDVTTTFTLSGSSELPLNRGMHNPDNPDFVYFGDLVPAHRTLYFLFEVRGRGKYVSTTVSNSPTTTSSGLIGFWSSQFFEGVSPHKYRVPLLIGGDYTIVGGTQNDIEGFAPPLTLTWSSMTAQHPPDITQGR